MDEEALSSTLGMRATDREGDGGAVRCECPALDGKELFRRYATWSREQHPWDIPISYQHFMRQWHDHFPRLVVGEKFEGTCDRCCVLKENFHKASTLELRKTAQDAWDAHSGPQEAVP